MKIIHCADLHLDSRMESNLPPEKAKERRMELYLSFADMVGYAKENGVRVIMIAGDMFDTKNGQIRIRNRVLELISDTPQIDFLYLKGNHDGAYFFDEDKRPDNLKLFSGEWGRYSYGCVDIYGCEECADMYSSFSADEGRTNIVMLHGQEVSGNVTGTELINIPAMRGRGIDYLALGHIHSYRCGKIDDRGIYCYCGCLEGRGFDECGEKGFVLLDADENGVRHSFIPFARRLLHTVEIPLEGYMTGTQIIEHIEGAVSDIPSKDMVKLVLTGEIDERTDIDAAFILSRLSRFYFIKLYDQTEIMIDYEDYAKDISLKGEFIRLVGEQDIDEDRKREIIITGIRALAGREIDI